MTSEISVFDLFSIGIGPSSSHTVGPMRAAALFLGELGQRSQLESVCALRVDLYGSLAATGKAHGTDRALLLGLEGQTAEGVDVGEIDGRVARTRALRSLRLGGRHPVAFHEERDIVFHRRERLSRHPNGLTLTVLGPSGLPLLSRTYFSIGGGFVVTDDASDGGNGEPPLPFPFSSGAELLAHCKREATSISELMWANESARRPAAEIRQGLLRIWGTMRSCVERGLTTEGTLPGFLKVPRRAARMYRDLEASSASDDLRTLDYVNAFALAVSEENAAGGRVVTAPTNGAAGIIPAVLHYYTRFVPGATEDRIVDFLLVAAAIGTLCKKNASISGAEVGCQGEVGSATAMAAAGLCEVLGGSPEQVENAAEIGIEHNLGLTCDPVGGYVQVPCIERNAVGAVKAVNAARVALHGDGGHVVSLDKALETMRRTGADMHTRYKETARGGLAVSVPEC